MKFLLSNAKYYGKKEEKAKYTIYCYFYIS